ncbi:MAG: YceI family protein [Bacteroidetes bacterium]|nr:YceI family protein [Bacteroidota bacterium]
MNNYFFTILLASTIIISSCGSEKASENTETTCFYEYEKTDSISLKWTAYKTSEKVAVAGTFNEIIVSGGEKSTKLTEVLNTIKFTISTKSTNTTNPERDATIVNGFFGAMLNTDLILGQVSGVEGDNEKGKCSFFVTINDVEKEITMDYSVSDNVVKLVGELDLNNWNAKDAITSLNKVCDEKHKGADGVSVLWPNVGLEISVALTKRCH